MFNRLKTINKHQNGFTLVELLVVLAITALLTGGITVSIFQVLNINSFGNTHMLAVRQVQNAGYWVSHDAQMAQTISPANDSDGFPLTLDWTEYWDGDLHHVVYTIEDTDLWRDYDGQRTLIAQYIDSATNCNFTSGGAFTLPDTNDAFTIIATADTDVVTLAITGGSVSVALSGGGSYAGGIITFAASDETAVVTALEADTEGTWALTSGTPISAITTDDNANAGLKTSDVLVFTVTSTVSDWRVATETRVYEVIPRRGS